MNDFDYTMKTKKSEDDSNLVGYEPSDREKGENREPKQITSSSNVFGTVAAGKSSKNENIFVVSQKRGKQNEALSREEKNLKEQTKIKSGDSCKQVFMNLHDKERGAVEYRNDENRTALFVRDSIQRALDSKDFEVQEDVLPFTKITAHKKQLEKLHAERRLFGKADVTLDKAIEELSNQITREEQHCMRFKRQLEEMNAQLNEHKYEKDDIICFFVKRLEELEDGSDDDDTSDNEDE